MAWTAGVDRTTGALISASDWNSYLGATGSLAYLKAGPTIDGATTIAGALGAATYALTLQNTTSTGLTGALVKDSSTNKQWIQSYSSGYVGTGSLGQTAASTSEFGAANPLYVGTQGVNPLYLVTNGTVRASFDNTTGAFVVSGATSATYPVDITATSNGVARAVRITNTGNSTAYAGFLPVSDTVTSVLASMGSGYSAPYAGKGLLQTNATAGLMIQNVNNGPIQFYVDASGATLAYYISSAGHLLAGTDNTVDIGASGATRPRNVYVATSLRVGTNPAQTGAIRLENNAGAIYGRNAANSQDIALVVANSSDNVVVGDSTNANNMLLNVKNSGQFQLVVAGTAVLIGDAGFWAPNSNGTVNLGGPSNRWATVYAATGTINTSSRAAKQDIRPLDAVAALDVVRRTRICTFAYRSDDPFVVAHRRVGFIAEDTDRILSLDGGSAEPQTTASVAIAAIQELDRRLSLVEARP